MIRSSRIRDHRPFPYSSMQQQPSRRDHTWLRAYLQAKAISSSNIDICVEKLVHQEGFGCAETFKHVPPAEINRKYLQSLGITGLGTQQAIFDLHANLQENFATPYVHDLTDICNEPIVKQSVSVACTSSHTSRSTSHEANSKVSASDPPPAVYKALKSSRKVTGKMTAVNLSTFNNTFNKSQAKTVPTAAATSSTSARRVATPAPSLLRALPTERTPPKYTDSIFEPLMSPLDLTSTVKAAPAIPASTASTPASTATTSTLTQTLKASTFCTTSRAAPYMAVPTCVLASAPERVQTIKYDGARTPVPPADLPRKFRKIKESGERVP